MRFHSLLRLFPWVVCLGLFSIAAPGLRAQFSSGGFNYSVTGGNATITGYTGSGGAVTIPATLGGFPVTAIGNLAFSTLSGGGATSETGSVTSVTLPNGLLTIGQYSFAEISSLTTVTIPASVTLIDYDAFALCLGLTTITFEGNAPTYVNGQPFDQDTSASITYPAGATGWSSPYYGIPATPFPFSFTSSGSAVTITGYSGSGGAVIIPATVAGLPVTTIAASAFQGASLTSVSIPSGVTSVGSTAFASCATLTSVQFQGNAPTVGSNVFQGDSSAAITYLPGTTGWTNPFAGIPAAVSPFTFSISNGATITGYTGSGGAVTIPSTIAGDPVTAIAASAFQGKGLTSLTIPGSVMTIGSSAFAGNGSLSAITFLGNPPSLSNDTTVFQGDSSATITYLPNTTGWGSTFDGLPANQLSFQYTVTSGAVTINGYTGTGGVVTFPATIAGYPVTTIGGNVFPNGTPVTSVVIPSGVTTIASSAFGSSTLSSVSIPGTVATIGSSAFSGCTALTSVTIPSSVTNLGAEVFQGCTSLASVTVSNGVPSIGDEAFQYCAALTSITIPASVTTIGTDSFQGCSSLTTLTIPAAVTSIGVGAFQACTHLGLITFQGNAPSADSSAFTGDTHASISYPYTATGWTDPFAGLRTASNLFTFSISGGAVTITGYNGTGGTVIIPATIEGDPVTAIGANALQGKGVTSLTVPGNVTTIGASAVAGNASLTSVAFLGNAPTADPTAFQGDSSATVTYLPFTTGWSATFDGLPTFQLNYSYTVSGGSITITGYQGSGGAVTIPAAIAGYPVTAIGSSVFAGVTTLTSVVIPSGVTSIGASAFANCTSLASVTIPGTVTAIGANAFQGCTALTTLTIPASVANIGADAFQSCTSLGVITFQGSAPSVDPTAFQGDTGASIAFPFGTSGWSNPFAGLPAAADSYVRLVNLSARAFVNTGGNVLIAGFGISGAGSKQLLLRGVGPDMNSYFGVPDDLNDASLALYDNGQQTGEAGIGAKVISSNNGWQNNSVAGNSPEIPQVSVSVASAGIMNALGAFPYLANSLDAAMLVTVPSSSFTAQVSGLGASPTGVALAEIYDADTGSPAARLINLSARCQVGIGFNILIAGFGISGNTNDTVLIRGVGPGLTSTFGLPGTMTNPQLVLFDDGNRPGENGASRAIATNAGWNTAPSLGTSPVVASVQVATVQAMNAVGAFSLNNGSTDAAMLVTLPPGSYTAQLSGVGGTTGIGLVEVYEDL